MSNQVGIAVMTRLKRGDLIGFVVVTTLNMVMSDTLIRERTTSFTKFDYKL